MTLNRSAVSERSIVKKLTPLFLAIGLSLAAVPSFAEANGDEAPPQTSGLRPLVLHQPLIPMVRPLAPPERSTAEVVGDVLWKTGEGPTRAGTYVIIIGVLGLIWVARKLFR